MQTGDSNWSNSATTFVSPVNLKFYQNNELDFKATYIADDKKINKDFPCQYH